MFGEVGDEVHFIDEARRAMEMYHPESRSGIPEEHWRELAAHHSNAIRDWLRDLYQFVGSGMGTATDHLGGNLLDFRARHIFNVAVAEDRQAGARWVQHANDSTIDLVQGLNPHIDWPGSAVFDVGPGGAAGESWRIRDMEMFENVPALGLFRLAGGALLVIPKPLQVMEIELAAGLFPQPALQHNHPMRHDEQFMARELAGGLFGQPALPQHALPQPAIQQNNMTERDEQVDPRASEVNVRIVAGVRTVRLVLNDINPVVAQAYPVLYTILNPVWPLLLFILDVLVGVINQQAYDEYGLQFRAQVEIPGSWPEEDETGHPLYGDILKPGLYSQDVLIMRMMFVLACFIWLHSCIIDWRTVVHSQGE